MEWISLKTLAPSLYRVLTLEGCTAVVCGPPAVRLTSSHPTAPTFYHKVSHTHVYMYVCTYKCILLPTYTHMYILYCMYVYTYVHVHMYVYTYMCICMCIHTYICIIRKMVCICTLMHTSLNSRLDRYYLFQNPCTKPTVPVMVLIYSKYKEYNT